MEYRDGETKVGGFRTNRYFCISGQWFFSTREHLQVGPFSSRDEAEMELLFFLRHLGEWGVYASPYNTDFSGLGCRSHNRQTSTL